MLLSAPCSLLELLLFINQKKENHLFFSNGNIEVSFHEIQTVTCFTERWIDSVSLLTIKFPQLLVHRILILLDQQYQTIGSQTCQLLP